MFGLFGGNDDGTDDEQFNDVKHYLDGNTQTEGSMPTDVQYDPTSDYANNKSGRYSSLPRNPGLDYGEFRDEDYK